MAAGGSGKLSLSEELFWEVLRRIQDSEEAGFDSVLYHAPKNGSFFFVLIPPATPFRPKPEKRLSNGDNPRDHGERDHGPG